MRKTDQCAINLRGAHELRFHLGQSHRPDCSALIYFQMRFMRLRIRFVSFSMSSSFFREDRESTKRTSFSRSSSNALAILTSSCASLTFFSYSALRISSCCLLPLGSRTSSGSSSWAADRWLLLASSQLRGQRRRNDQQQAAPDLGMGLQIPHFGIIPNIRMNDVNIGVIGLGNVGSGALAILAANADQIALKLGFRLRVTAVCSRSVASQKRCPRPGRCTSHHGLARCRDQSESGYRRRTDRRNDGGARDHRGRHR